MKRILYRMMSEPLRKRIAARATGKHGQFLNALGANAQLHEWLNANRPFPYFQHRYQMYEEIQSRYLSSAPIDYLEFGVRHGDSLFKWASLNTHSESRFFGFDSFEGLPEDWISVSATAPKGIFSVNGLIPQTDDPRIHLVKG